MCDGRVVRCHSIRFMNFLIIVARGVWLWFALGRDYPRGSRESFGHFVTPPVFPSFNVRMPHFRFNVSLFVPVTEFLCVGREYGKQLLPWHTH